MALVKRFFDAAVEYRTWSTSDKARIPTGYSIIDSRTQGGGALGEVILFQCRSQVGKTTFGLNVVNNNPDVPAIIFSLEMHARYLVPRLAGMHTNTPTDQIYDDLKHTGYSEAVKQTVDDFPKLFIADEPAMSFKDMDHALQEAEAAIGERPRLAVIDFMELIGGIPSLSDVSKVDALARKAKDWTRKNDLLLVLLHQVSRGAGGAGHEPLDITSGRYGGEVSADYVLGAYRPCLMPGIRQEDYLACIGDFYLQFLKTRGGHEIHPEGIRHYLNPRTLKISEAVPPPELFPADFRPAAPILKADVEEFGVHWSDEDDGYGLIEFTS